MNESVGELEFPWQYAQHLRAVAVQWTAREIPRRMKAKGQRSPLSIDQWGRLWNEKGGNDPRQKKNRIKVVIEEGEGEKVCEERTQEATKVRVD